MNLRNTLTLVATLALACDSTTTESPDETRQAAAPAPAQDSNAASTVSFEIGADWEASVDEAVAQLRDNDPDRAKTLYELGPRTTRAGTLRLTGPLVRDPIVAAVFLDRLRQGTESAEVRAALAEALPRTTGPFAPAVVELLADEGDSTVRVAMVATMRTADAQSARTGLELGLRDADAAVRQTAASTVARRRDGASFETGLLAAAADEDVAVKVAAMRSLGALRIDGAKSLLEGELDSVFADVRLEAVRGLMRIDPAHAAGLSTVRALTSDDDPRVAKAANKAVSTSL